jgi:putative salt-induced outer membrane protein YdiY
LYGVSDGEKTAERIDLDTRFERRFYPYFVFWDFKFYRNPFQGYSYSIGTGPGVGRYIIDNDRTYLTLAYYIHWIYNRLTDRYTSLPLDKKIERYFLHHIEERFKFKITENLKLKERLVYKVSSRSMKDYFINFNIALENKMTKNLYLVISYEVNYQNIPVGKKIKRTDTIFMTSIKYKF